MGIKVIATGISMLAVFAIGRTARADCNLSDGVCSSQINTGATGAEAFYGKITSDGGVAIYGDAHSGTGNGTGVAGLSATGVGVSGASGTGYGGYFSSSSIAGYFSTSPTTGTGIVSVGVTAAWLQGNVYSTATYYSTGSQTTITHYSDIRLKKNVKPLEGSLDQLLKLRGVTYEWKEPEEHGHELGTQRGFVAQEVEKVFPDWVGVDSKGIKTLNTRGLEPMLVESLRSLKKENEALEERVKVLESRRNVLTAGIGGPLGFIGLGLLAGALALSSRRALSHLKPSQSGTGRRSI